METLDMTEFQGGRAPENKAPTRISGISVLKYLYKKGFGEIIQRAEAFLSHSGVFLCHSEGAARRIHLKSERILRSAQNDVQEKQAAFTMAEVLITLGIIGIVAAMTIPQMMQGYRKKVVETELQKAVSMLNQAIMLSSVYNNTPDNWGIANGATDTFELYIKPYIDVATECENKAIGDPKNICCNYVYGFTGTNAFHTGRKYILKNGIAISFSSGVTLGTSPRRGVFFVFLETGAHKYILGKNVFPFNLIVQDNKKYLVTGTRDYPSHATFCSGLKTRAQMIDMCENGTGNSSGGGKEGYVTGITCTAMIECNNWKIPDDYPIRF